MIEHILAGIGILAFAGIILATILADKENEKRRERPLIDIR
jgi:hypothetical protein